jgi:hypothetical protein
VDVERARILQMSDAPRSGSAPRVSTPDRAETLPLAAATLASSERSSARRNTQLYIVETLNNKKLSNIRQFPSVRMNRTLSVAPGRRREAMRLRSHDGRPRARAKGRILMPALAIHGFAASLGIPPRRFAASAK